MVCKFFRNKVVEKIIQIKHNIDGTDTDEDRTKRKKLKVML